MNMNFIANGNFGVDPSALRRAAGRFVTGVGVVTASDGAGEPHGATVNAMTCLSLDPPLYLACLANTSATLKAILQTRTFGINVLSVGQSAHAMTFASKAADKFGAVATESGELGVPLLRDAVATIECEVESLFPGGDHTIVVGRVRAIQECDNVPLVMRSGRFVALSGLAPDA
jgi:flavin reductase (DIM6/NTAB) family NADH-FMN oxidoreductase RutF